MNLVPGSNKAAAGIFLLIAVQSLWACAPTANSLSDNKASRATAASIPAGAKPKGRNPYSPDVLNDSYVLEQQRATAEALRRSCEQTKEHCELVAEAGRYLDEQDARR